MNNEKNITNKNKIENSQYSNKKQRREQRIELFKIALQELVHQIKITIIIVIIVSVIILFLCSTAWYILKSNDEKETIISFLKTNNSLNL